MNSARTIGNGTSRTVGRGFVALALALAIAGLALPGVASANTCNGLFTIDYVPPSPNFPVPGDIVRVRLTLGTGSITGGTELTINRLRFDLDCNDMFALGVPCTDEGAIVEYEGDGTITTTCGVVWASGHAIGSAPNEVVFTPTPTVMIPANTPIPPGFCNLEFDIKVLSYSTDTSPDEIQEATGYLASQGDAMCNNTPTPLSSSSTQSSSIELCPNCDLGSACSMDSCNQDTGQCVHTPKPFSTPCPDTDGDLCTIPGCNGTIGSDNGVVLGCDQHHDTVVCPPDGNPCTNDAGCNPDTGQCEYPPTDFSTPCPDTDQDTCTTPGCDGLGTCDQRHIVCTTSTSTSTSSTTTTSTSSTTSTTLRCGNGVIDPGEQCDPPGSITCPPGSPAGAFLPCNPDCTCPSVGGDHYVCYNSGTNEPNLPDVTLVDQFETATFHPKRCHPKSFCAPAAKNGGQVNDPVTHLKGYKLARLSGTNPRVTVDVTNQFGTVRLTTKKTDRLLVPSAKSLTAPPPPLAPALPGNQHYKCYRVSAAAFTPVTVTAQDQFGTRQLQLKKIVSLCNPVSKNGSQVKDPTRHLLCYSVRRATRPPSPVFVTNQFGSQTVNLAGEGAFCVPSTKTVVP